MEPLKIEATKSTPYVEFDAAVHKLIIRGESYPENSFQFYEPLLKWLESYIPELEEEEIEVEMMITYLNTSSVKSIMCILDLLEEAFLDGKHIRINWFYDEENELSYELAEDFMDDLEIPFNLVPLEAE